jgi:hypothetical protein
MWAGIISQPPNPDKTTTKAAMMREEVKTAGLKSVNSFV